MGRTATKSKPVYAAVDPLNSPLHWLGGKERLALDHIALFPPHTIYNDAYGGGAGTLVKKAPSKFEVYNDKNRDLVNFFRVLRNPKQFREFYRLVQLTPYSREEYNTFRLLWEQETDEIQRAYMWYCVARWSYGGKFGQSWGGAATLVRRDVAASVSAWLSTVEHLPEISARFLAVQVECYEARTIIQKHDTPDTFHYLDPPYLNRKHASSKYTVDMTEAEHRKLVDLLLKGGKNGPLKGKVMLCGYKNELYEELETAGWNRIDYATIADVGRARKNADDSGSHRIDCVWVNYPCGVMPGFWNL